MGSLGKVLKDLIEFVFTYHLSVLKTSQLVQTNGTLKPLLKFGMYKLECPLEMFD